jgi:hypothetical protein
MRKKNESLEGTVRCIPSGSVVISRVPATDMSGPAGRDLPERGTQLEKKLTRFKRDVLRPCIFDIHQRREVKFSRTNRVIFVS